MNKYLVTYEYKERINNYVTNTGISTNIFTLDELKKTINRYQNSDGYIKILFCEKL